MGLRDCAGYTKHTAKCTDCDFEESVNSIQMLCAHAALSVEDGDDCPEEGCPGIIMVESEEISADSHRQGYLAYHADDDHDRNR